MEARSVYYLVERHAASLVMFHGPWLCLNTLELIGWGRATLGWKQSAVEENAALTGVRSCTRAPTDSKPQTVEQGRIYKEALCIQG